MGIKAKSWNKVHMKKESKYCRWNRPLKMISCRQAKWIKEQSYRLLQLLFLSSKDGKDYPLLSVSATRRLRIMISRCPAMARNYSAEKCNKIRSSQVAAAAAAVTGRMDRAKKDETGSQSEIFPNSRRPFQPQTTICICFPFHLPLTRGPGKYRLPPRILEHILHKCQLCLQPAREEDSTIQ
jgi:hypothetical protein